MGPWYRTPAVAQPSLAQRLFGGTGEAVGSLAGGIIRPLILPLVLLIVLVVALTVLLGRFERTVGGLA